MEEEVAQELKRSLFIERLREKTVCNKSDPVCEWEEVFYHSSEDLDDREKRCICSTPIKHIYKIKNRLTGEVLEIGSECILRWFGAKKCDQCKCVLGCISKRRQQHKNGDLFAFWCPSCVRERKKKLGDLTIGIHKFSKIINDIDQINWFLEHKEHHFNYNKFKEYVSMFYPIVYEEVEQ